MIVESSFPYWGPLLFKSNIDKKQIEELKKLCVKNTSNNNNTVAHIEEQYSIDCLKYEKIIQPQLHCFEKVYFQYYQKSINDLKITQAWVNFMKKGEFNPIHIHENCNLSSVVYLEVPNKIKEEFENFKGNSLGGPGSIEFFYGEQNEDVLSYRAYFPKKGDLFIFPKMLRHCVSPFKSNVIRISVAANLIYKV